MSICQHEADVPFVNTIGNLVKVGCDALCMMPPDYFRSVFGPRDSWNPNATPDSEFQVLSLREWQQTLAYLARIIVPAPLDEEPRRLPEHLRDLVYRPTHEFTFAPEKLDGKPLRGRSTESWFFINGIATDCAVAKLNARHIARLFRRPLTVIHNRTESLGLDLFECAVGKLWYASKTSLRDMKLILEPTAYAFPRICRELEDENKERVIVLCHSQGTIIMSNVIRALACSKFRKRMEQACRECGLEQVRFRCRGRVDASKLEVYAFANCATRMTWETTRGRCPAGHPPYIESFGNENDLVARLGMLAPNRRERGICIDGRGFLRKDAWGHLLNVHYLAPMERYLTHGGDHPFTPLPGTHANARPRLYGYYNGKSPRIR